MQTRRVKGKSRGRRSQAGTGVVRKLGRAAAALREGQFSDARALAEECLAAARAGSRERSLALLALAESQRALGEYVEAYRNYSEYLRTDDPGLPKVHRRNLYECLCHVRQVDLSPQLDGHLVQYLADESVDPRSVGPLVVAVLMSRYTPGSLTLDTAARDELLITSLEQAPLHSKRVEDVLVDIRRELLHVGMNEGLPARYARLAGAIGVYAWHTEYIAPVAGIEDEAISALARGIGEHVSCAEDLTTHQHALLLAAMYMPLNDLPNASRWRMLEPGKWPAVMRPLVQQSFVEEREEIALMQDIAELAPITDEVSLAVRGQYEVHPYPRWQRLNRLSKPDSYFSEHAALRDTLTNPGMLEQTPLDILVAGCGTGQHPLSLARGVTRAQVTALDVSRRSIAYARRKAMAHGVRNIEFLHGDILDLPECGRQWPLIESCGVLHHMASPERGLQALLEVLAPGGVLHLAVYSTVARRLITMFRASVQDRGLEPSLANIRRMREGFIQVTERVEGCSDLYATSECRDLLFHRQEHTFTIPGLRALLARNHLRFAGFSFRHGAAREAYRAAYPGDTTMLNLDNWEEFETENPDTFWEMYSFHCEREEG